MHDGLEPGVKLGTYQIERPLGRVGFVYLAHDTTLHRRVALKVLSSPVAVVTLPASALRVPRSGDRPAVRALGA